MNIECLMVLALMQEACVTRYTGDSGMK